MIPPDLYANFLHEPTPWMKHAACKPHPTDWWFPKRGEPVEQAKTICYTCPVRIDCLNYALNIYKESGAECQAENDATSAANQQNPSDTAHPPDTNNTSDAASNPAHNAAKPTPKQSPDAKTKTNHDN